MTRRQREYLFPVKSSGRFRRPDPRHLVGGIEHVLDDIPGSAPDLGVGIDDHINGVHRVAEDVVKESVVAGLSRASSEQGGKDGPDSQAVTKPVDVQFVVGKSFIGQGAVLLSRGFSNIAMLLRGRKC